MCQPTTLLQAENATNSFGQQGGEATTEPRLEAAQADLFAEDASPATAQLSEQVRRVAPQDTTLLLLGETGTGKTRLARRIHELSPRCNDPFLVVDCGALSPSLTESELFGHVKGAFTGADRTRPGKLAAVGRGTLVLDEVNSLPLTLQVKLLRAVEERVFEPIGCNQTQQLRARLIVVSNTPLDQEVEAGRFRADLYYRLNVVAFYLPPLRDRPTAIVPLARHFLGELVARNRPDVTGITAAALAALERYPWPGNLRQLKNALERAVALCRGPEVDVHDLPEGVRCPRADARLLTPGEMFAQLLKGREPARHAKHAPSRPQEGSAAVAM
jgi:two-component system response regulator HydG